MTRCGTVRGATACPPGTSKVKFDGPDWTTCEQTSTWSPPPYECKLDLNILVVKPH